MLTKANMYKLTDLSGKEQSPKFIELLTSTWDELHNNTNIFRYKLDKLEERIVSEKYLLQLNPDRRAKRRVPEEMNSLFQPFDEKKFNFTKVLPQEILFSIEDKDADIHTVLVNVSPISRYHSLLCPSVNKCLPQRVTLESLALAVDILFLAQDRDLRILFNSLCAYASVNHLHYHLFLDKNYFYVEKVKWQHLKGNTYKLDEKYPMPAFCFRIHKHSILEICKEIYNILEHLTERSIAHNMLVTTRGVQGGSDTVNVIVWPRRNTTGAKQFAAMNVAVLELSGWFPIYDMENFINLTAEDLEKEICKWRIEDFDFLCEEIKCL